MNYKYFSSHTIKLIQNTIKYYLDNLNLSADMHLLLAISGGSDSLALACIFKYFSLHSNLKLSAITINHGLRVEAYQEVAFVKNICNHLGIDCAIESFDARTLAFKLNTGLENASRQGRYQLYEKYRIKFNADYIVLGHHCHDLSEDVLMRLLRGCGWPALGGMKARDDQRHIIRPLLWANPQDLKYVLSDFDIGWMEDKSNFSMEFLRNRVRYNLLPTIRKENPAFDKKVNNLHEFAQIDEDYWKNIINNLKENKYWEENSTSDKIYINFDLKLLKTLHKALRLRLYMYAINYLSNVLITENKSQGRAESLFKLDKALIDDKRNKLFQFGANLSAIIGTKILSFRKTI